ncbi:hypothetical protein H6F43_04905, partial [Leptolyngbya sp. FACHB-36]|nr:hypothetical protein [Leptolyngbya sp. FACHB-36]
MTRLASRRTLISLTVLLSAGLHGALLMMPVPSSPPIPEKLTKTVKVSQLPLLKPSPKPSVKPSTKPSTKSQPSAKPTIAQPKRLQSPVIARSPISDRPPAPRSAPAPSPAPAASAVPTPNPAPSVEPPSLAQAIQLNGAQPSCGGASDCWQIGETQWRSIAG